MAWKSGVDALARWARCSASCSLTCTVRPAEAVVHLARNGQPLQAALKYAVRVRVISRTTPARQVTVRAASSTTKSAIVKPPSIEGVSGCGLMTAESPARSSAASIAPLPYAESASTSTETPSPAPSPGLVPAPSPELVPGLVPAPSPELVPGLVPAPSPGLVSGLVSGPSSGP